MLYIQDEVDLKRTKPAFDAIGLGLVDAPHRLFNVPDVYQFTDLPLGWNGASGVFPPVFTQQIVESFFIHPPNSLN